MTAAIFALVMTAALLLCLRRVRTDNEAIRLIRKWRAGE
jgi:hypothetical protein